MTITLQAVNELIASLESAGELSIREQKFLKLAKAFKQLAEENLTMNRLLTDISDNHVEYFSEGEGYMFAGVPLDYVSEINMYVSRDVNAENPFPGTDRIVAGIKADGVEMFALMFAEEAIKDNNITTGWKARASRAASEYAELLREGAK
ncbi:Uncharacterised protein [Klebsiella pneumoniae]|uniref:hypothetical protein n=1 Tax=Klebsiella pneumoniae TaxID=573 RepID=UPI000E2CEAE5|nr:Uncharacterised protein [Klebsiella pneumoniae]SXM10368.1 Uncharacterised protein [Klebsiella pneumoniae]SYV77016.1 Uncharacterised protein [Klebsiella pneumoniae]